MRLTRRFVTAIAAALPAVGLAAALAAAETPDDIIAARQAGYKHIGDIAKSMKEAVDAGSDVAGFAGPAREIADWGRKLTTMFPPGTEQGHNTKAKPEIWTDRPGFEADAAALVVEADKLSAVAATGDKSAFAAQFKATGGKCYACHQSYRYKLS